MLSSGVFPTFPKHDKRHVVLLIIDPQVDFHEGGSLAVTGATADAKRISNMIAAHAPEIGQIFVTMDSHHRNHIAHASFWFTEKPGEHTANCKLRPKPQTKYATAAVYEPEAFTMIEHKYIGPGMWEPVDQSLMEHCKRYSSALEFRMKLIIWPGTIF
jgi:nicotinamidase/pyrazinamidase